VLGIVQFGPLRAAIHRLRGIWIVRVAMVSLQPRGVTMESDKPGRLEDRERRQNAEQQHGDTFAVDSDEPTDTSGIPTEDGEEPYGRRGAPRRQSGLEASQRRAVIAWVAHRPKLETGEIGPCAAPLQRPHCRVEWRDGPAVQYDEAENLPIVDAHRVCG
jgi:hypothetical protein